MHQQSKRYMRVTCVAGDRWTVASTVHAARETVATQTQVDHPRDPW